MEQELADLLVDLAKQERLSGTGYDADDVEAMMRRAAYAGQRDTQATMASMSADIPTGMAPPLPPPPPSQLDQAEDVAAGTTRGGLVRPVPKAQDVIQSLDHVSSDLGGVLQLKEDMVFPSTLPWGIPALREDMLCTELPPNLETWAGNRASTDSGSNWYLYNYGVSATGLPFPRTILGFYSNDSYFENWWNLPGFYTAKMINAGIATAIVPDFSLWVDDPPALQLFNVYRSQWLGRYFQEAGLKVIPNITWADARSYDYAWLGIPVGAPLVSLCLQTVDLKNTNEAAACMDGIVSSLAHLRPAHVLVYAASVGHDLFRKCAPTQPATFLLNFQAVLSASGVRSRKPKGPAVRQEP
jgi:hypothetical protein